LYWVRLRGFALAPLYLYLRAQASGVIGLNF
jgi:hypothetical protein